MTILYFYLKTGGGHLAPARSLAEKAEKLYGKRVKSVLIDGLEKASPLLRFIVEKGYLISQNYLHFLWRTLYALHYLPFVRECSLLILHIGMKRHIKEYIEKHKPDRIVVLHFFLIKLIEKVVKEKNLDIPCFVLVTDPYTTHHFWYVGKRSHYILFSDRAVETALRCKVPTESLSTFPNFFLNANFFHPPDTKKMEELKKELNIIEGQPTVLIVGGGDGMPNGEILINLLSIRLKNTNIVMVCGKNTIQKRTAELAKKAHPKVGGRVIGFTDSMREIIALSDVVITKAGASMILEILTMKKIPVVHRYIWRQEKGNVEYVVNNNFGLYVRNPIKLVSVVKRLLQKGELFQTLHDNLSRYLPKDESKEIISFIVNYHPAERE